MGRDAKSSLTLRRESGYTQPGAPGPAAAASDQSERTGGPACAQDGGGSAQWGGGAWAEPEDSDEQVFDLTTDSVAGAGIAGASAGAGKAPPPTCRVPSSGPAGCRCKCREKVLCG